MRTSALRSSSLQGWTQKRGLEASMGNPARDARRYAARKAAGLCTWGVCPRRALEGILCRHHRARMRALLRERASEQYEEKRRTGLCTYGACKRRTKRFRCEIHLALHRAVQAARYRGEK